MMITEIIKAIAASNLSASLVAVALGLRRSSGVEASPEQWCWGFARAVVLGLRRSSGFGVRNSAKVRVFVVVIDIE